MLGRFGNIIAYFLKFVYKDSRNDIYQWKNGPSRTPVPTKNTNLVGTGLPDGPHCFTTILLTGRILAGLAAARVTKVACGNLTFWQSTGLSFITFAPLRYLTVRGSQSEVYPRVDCLSVSSKFSFYIFCECFFEGVWGDFFQRKRFPHKKRVSYSINLFFSLSTSRTAASSSL